MAEKQPCGKGKTPLLGNIFICIGQYSLSPPPPEGTGERVYIHTPKNTIAFDVSPQLVASQESSVCADCFALRLF